MRTNGESCDDCFARDPHSRHRHYLDMGRTYGLTGAIEHVREFYLAQFPFDQERARRYASDIQEWLGGQMATYSHVPDDHTGAFLPWHEGRARTISAMHATYEALGKANELARQEREWKHEVKGFHKLIVPDPTPVREPGEDPEELEEC